MTAMICKPEDFLLFISLMEKCVYLTSTVALSIGSCPCKFQSPGVLSFDRPYRFRQAKSVKEFMRK
jgi:hypothetical protein